MSKNKPENFLFAEIRLQKSPAPERIGLKIHYATLIIILTNIYILFQNCSPESEVQALWHVFCSLMQWKFKKKKRLQNNKFCNQGKNLANHSMEIQII